MSKNIDSILGQLPLDADVKSGLKEAFQSALDDAKVIQESLVREELAGQYNNDINKIHEAFGAFLEERIKPHVLELRESVDSVDALKAEYAQKINMVQENAKVQVRGRLAALEQVMDERLNIELTELHEDVVANRNAAITAINEAKIKAARDNQVFRTKAAKVLEHIINVKVPASLEPLREDIIAARNDNFGREVFEAFQNVFRRQFFDTNSEFKKVIAENESLKEEATMTKIKAAKIIKESRVDARKAKTAYGNLSESVRRKQTMNRLLKPLSGATRNQMKTLLEATKTDRLDSTFRKALPQVVGHTNKRKITENKKHRKMELRADLVESNDNEIYDEFEDELNQITRLAGNMK